MEPTTSKMRPYSIGIVAINKEIGKDTVEVLAIEDHPMVHGEITDHYDEYKVDGRDAAGTNYSINMKTTATIRAKWLKVGGGNRATAPDLRRGEKVQIYQYADTDKYYWSELDTSDNIRRKETAVFAFSNEKNENTPNSPDNNYRMMVSAHKGLVEFTTPNNDGEKYKYKIQINAKEGKIVISDDSDQSFVLDSPANKIRLQNAQGTAIEINGANIIFHCSGTMSQSGGGNSTLEKLSVTGGMSSDTIDAPTITATTVSASSSVTAPNIK